MATTADRLVDDYLKRLRQELRDLPPARRSEMVDDIEQHIAEGRAELPSDSEAEIRTLLDRIGPPSVIAADERARLGPKRPSNTREVVAIVLLLVGGFAFFVGWLAGVVLLWKSDVWTTRDKLIGTLVVPGGPGARRHRRGLRRGQRRGLAAHALDPGRRRCSSHRSSPWPTSRCACAAR